jgi:hypothetical protein
VPTKSQRGLPPNGNPDSLDNLTHEQYLAKRAELLKIIEDTDTNIKKYEEENKIEFFKPIEPYQARILEYLHNGKKVIALVGGNGIGKTTLGAVVVGSACLGIEPWSGLKLPPPLDKPPVKVRIICQDWEKHADTVIVPKLKEYLPKGQYTTAKNNVGVESVFTFKNKSTIELITNKQSTSDHEGWEGEIIWGDEPFDRDKYVANLRGLRKPADKGGMGVFLITMTAVKEAWILDEIIRNQDPAYASVTEVPQKANPYLSEEYLRVFRASLRENEIIARIDGGWLNLVGLVWKFNADKHLIDPFEVPTDWPVVPMIDFHYSIPQALGFYTADPHGFHYVIDEMWADKMSPEQMADVIIRAKLTKGWRIEEAFIDPLSKGDTAYLKNRMGSDTQDSFTIIKDRLSDHGIELEIFSRDKASGVLAVEKMLEGPNGMPTLFFFRNLNKIEKEGHIWEIQRWVYNDRNEPKDENDHFMQCLYAYSLVGNKWTPMAYHRGDLKSELDFNVFEDNYGKQAQL